MRSGQLNLIFVVICGCILGADYVSANIPTIRIFSVKTGMKIGPLPTDELESALATAIFQPIKNFIGISVYDDRWPAIERNNFAETTSHLHSQITMDGEVLYFVWSRQNTPEQITGAFDKFKQALKRSNGGAPINITMMATENLDGLYKCDCSDPVACLTFENPAFKSYLEGLEITPAPHQQTRCRR